MQQYEHNVHFIYIYNYNDDAGACAGLPKFSAPSSISLCQVQAQPSECALSEQQWRNTNKRMAILTQMAFSIAVSNSNAKMLHNEFFSPTHKTCYTLKKRHAKQRCANRTSNISYLISDLCEYVLHNCWVLSSRRRAHLILPHARTSWELHLSCNANCFVCKIFYRATRLELRKCVRFISRFMWSMDLACANIVLMICRH